MTSRTADHEPPVRVRAFDDVTDLPALRAMARRCSLETLRHRFFRAAPAAFDFYLAVITTDLRQHTVVAVHDTGIVGIASLFQGGRDFPASEVAVLVEDAWQHRGIGLTLAEHLRAHAVAAGEEQVHAHLLATNHRARGLINRVCPDARTGVPENGVVESVLPVRTQNAVVDFRG